MFGEYEHWFLASFVGSQVDLDGLVCIFPYEGNVEMLILEFGDIDTVGIIFVYLIRASVESSC